LLISDMGSLSLLLVTLNNRGQGILCKIIKVEFS